MQPPRWARLVDAVAIAALALGAIVLLFGGFALMIGPARLSVRSPGRLFFVALALMAIRHAASPEQPVHRRLWAWLRATRSGSPGTIAAASLISRVAVVFVAYFAVLTIGVSAQRAGSVLSSDPLLDLPGRFDAGWYGTIAQNGYSFQGRFDRQQNVAFFPAFPFLMRAAGYLTGGFEPGVPQSWRLARILWAGTLMSILAFAWAAAYMVRLARDTIGEDHAGNAVALVAAYPFALFFSAAYAESLFLLGAVAAFYHFRRQEWAAAAAWGLLVGLTRPNGCFLSIPLGIMALQTYLRSFRAAPQPTDSPKPTNAPIRQLTKGLAAASASGFGMLAYSAYVKHLTGAWFGWARLHETWGRSFEGFAPLARGLGWVQNEGLLRVVGGLPFDTLNALGLLFALAMLWPVTRRLGGAWAVFILLNVIPPFMAGGVLSMGRITATLFPAFFALAALLPRRAVTPLVTACALAQGLATALFFTWRPLF